MSHKNCIILIMFFFILSGCARMPEDSFRINFVKIGMTKSEVVTILGMKNYPSGSTLFYKGDKFESWRLRRNWFNKQYHEDTGYNISEGLGFRGGLYILTFKNGKLINIIER